MAFNPKLLNPDQQKDFAALKRNTGGNFQNFDLNKRYGQQPRATPPGPGNLPPRAATPPGGGMPPMGQPRMATPPGPKLMPRPMPGPMNPGPMKPRMATPPGPKLMPKPMPRMQTPGGPRNLPPGGPVVPSPGGVGRHPIDDPSGGRGFIPPPVTGGNPGMKQPGVFGDPGPVVGGNVGFDPNGSPTPAPDYNQMPEMGPNRDLFMQLLQRQLGQNYRF